MNLLSYIQGNRKGKEAHRIEKEAMQDPFLADALEGFDTVKADHTERISYLRSRISSHKRSSSQQKIYLGIAASLLFCFMIGGYFLLNKRSDNLVAMSELAAKKTETELFMEIEEISLAEVEKPNTPEEIGVTRINRQQTATTQSPPTPVEEEMDVRQDNRQQTDAIPILITSVAEEMEDKIANKQQSDAIQNPVTSAGILKENELNAVEEVEKKPIAASRARSIPLETAKSSIPEPEIGMEAFEKYLKEAMKPLQNTECENIKGIVEVEFTIMEGKPANYVIRQSLCPAADKEAIRLIENGCKWAGKNGQKVVLKVSFL